jgi:hypothetical protein
MTTFDLAHVNTFVADLDAQMDHCDNSEGIDRAKPDEILGRYAKVCCSYRIHVRQWARAVSADAAVYDPRVEQTLRNKGQRLYSRALKSCQRGQEDEALCYELVILESALWDLYRLFKCWVSPQPGVGKATGMSDVMNVAESDWRPDIVSSLPPQLGEA